MARISALVLGVGLSLILAPTPGAMGDVTASVSWSNLGCTTDRCAYVASGDHHAHLSNGAATGTLEVDGVTEDTCSIPVSPFVDECQTQGPGREIATGSCATAVAITEALDGGSADDKEDACVE